MTNSKFNRMNPNKPVRVCTWHGLVWKDFKVPKNALFGVTNHTPWVLCKLPNIIGTQVNVWVKLPSGDWKERLCNVSEEDQESINTLHHLSTKVIYIKTLSAIAREAINKMMELSMEENLNDIEGFRPATSHTSIVQAHVLPSQRITQNMSMTGKARHQKPLDGRVNSHGFTDFEANAKPVIFPECYWVTGKNTPQVSHKKPKPDKVTRK